MPFASITYETPQEAAVAIAAAPLVLAGYPLVESIRSCRVQTDIAPGATPRYGRAPLGALGRSERQWTDADRDIVTPANDLLYFCGWLDLRTAPAILTLPPATGRYFVCELLDAWTENFLNLGVRNVPREGARYALTGPSTRGRVPAGTLAVDCPTDLVWLIGRVLVADEADLGEARALMNGFRLESEAAALPRSVAEWHADGDPALDFFANLVAAAAEFPDPRPDEGPGMAALLRAAGLAPGEPDSVARANARVQAGLKRAYADTMAVIEAHTKSQGRKAWGYSTRLGKWRGNLMLRAATAMKGLGALEAGETIYAMADFDATGEALDGGRAYELRFAAGALPPADAFWSVSMYGADRFFVPSPTGRHAIGDRTRGLEPEPDGGLVIAIGAARPAARAANWLPAPAGPFYLILRVYHPRTEFLEGRYVIPPVVRTA